MPLISARRDKRQLLAGELWIGRTGCRGADRCTGELRAFELLAGQRREMLAVRSLQVGNCRCGLLADGASGGTGGGRQEGEGRSGGAHIPFTQWARFRRGSGCDGRFSRKGQNGPGGGRSGDRTYGQDRERTSSRAGRMGTSVRRCCEYLSHPTDACRSVGAERNRGPLLRSSSSHPFRPRGRRRHCSHACPVAGGGSVSRTVERPAAPPGALPFESAGSGLRIQAFRWVTRGAPGRFSRYQPGRCCYRRWRWLPSLISRGFADSRRWWQFPVVWHGGAPS